VTGLTFTSSVGSQPLPRERFSSSANNGRSTSDSVGHSKVCFTRFTQLSDLPRTILLIGSSTTVYNLPRRRSWMVARAPRGSGGFITSDRLVTLSWDDMEMEAGFYAPVSDFKGRQYFSRLRRT
jgi:hypothetical protein